MDKLDNRKLYLKAAVNRYTECLIDVINGRDTWDCPALKSAYEELLRAAAELEIASENSKDNL